MTREVTQCCTEYTGNDRPYIQPYRTSLVRKPKKVTTYKNVNAECREWGLSLDTALTCFPRFLGREILCRCQGLAQGVIDSSGGASLHKEGEGREKRRMGSLGETSFSRVRSTYRTVGDLVCHTKLAVNTRVVSY